MHAYFDSSIILSCLLEDSLRVQAEELWNKYTEKVASILVHVACLNVLRRTPKQPGKLVPKEWILERLNKLDAMMAQIQIIPIDSAVLKALQNKPRTPECRS